VSTFDLHGHRAVVTGASAGIGAEIVRLLAASGCDVAFCARNRAGVDELAAAGAGLEGKVLPFVADMADGDDVARFCDEVEAQLGAPDILVNNVGASPSRNFLYMSDDEWEELFRLNLLSAVRCTRRFLPAMRAGGWGRVIMVATAAAKYPGAALIDYAASKAAMVATSTEIWNVKLVRSRSITRADAAWVAFAPCRAQASPGRSISNTAAVVSAPAASFPAPVMNDRRSIAAFTRRA